MTGNGSHTVDKLGTKRGAEVVQPQFEVFLLLAGKICVGRFRERFLHKFLKVLRWRQWRQSNNGGLT